MKTNIIIALLSVMTTLQAVSLINNKSEDKQQVNIPVAQEDVKCYTINRNKLIPPSQDISSNLEKLLNHPEIKGKKIVISQPGDFCVR